MARESLTFSTQLLQFCHLTNEDDLLEARAIVKMHAKDMNFSTLNQTKLVTAASELGRNVIEHGLGGSMQVESVTNGELVGMRMTFKDTGPGIIDMQLALTDGYSSQKGMGLGLTGSKRLMDDFELESVPNAGTTVVVIKWK